MSISSYILTALILDAFIISETEPFAHLTHSLDIWHKAKKLTLRLSEVAKRAPYRSLLSWIRPITNHFWYCSHACKGDAEKMVDIWYGILYHVTNQHFWPAGR